MGRKPNESDTSRWSLPTFLFVGLLSCSLVYMAVSLAFRATNSAFDWTVGSTKIVESDVSVVGRAEEFGADEVCCRGIENLEFWGDAVKWGTDFKFNSSRECCDACKEMCGKGDGPCLCNSWVFCGDRARCGEKFGESIGSPVNPNTKKHFAGYSKYAFGKLEESWTHFIQELLHLEETSGRSSARLVCWLKKQKHPLFPDVQDASELVIWTSGLIFGKGQTAVRTVGIVSLETEYGTLHIKLFPDCAPRSVAYIIELLRLRHCAGCHFYRAEDRGGSWDVEGNHHTGASFGPPFALIQGSLQAEGVEFKEIPKEACPTIKRGSVAWIGSGPEFFISLANHNEWKRAYTVFGSVLPEDMEIAERISKLPTKSDKWNNIEVSVLEKQVKLSLKRVERSQGALSLVADEGVKEKKGWKKLIRKARTSLIKSIQDSKQASKATLILDLRVHCQASDHVSVVPRRSGYQAPSESTIQISRSNILI
ncbi:hypothetical protein ACLOJK_010439 [Asimina triloba]